MAAHAYTLKESWQKKFSGGSVARRDGTALDVGVALKQGSGYIVTEVPGDDELLDEFEPLKRATLEEAEKAQSKSSGKSNDKEKKD